MPRIRKKTSNRASTNDRAKLRHKVSEGRKKNRKLAKKNVQWKSRVPKDPGIPGNMPFKDQILAEVAEERRRNEEEKMARKASKKTSTSASTSNPDSDSDNDNAEGAPSYTGVASLPSSTTAHTLPTKKSLLLSSLPSAAEEEQEENEEPLLFDPAFPDTRTALEKASVWIYVLDARDPEAWRSAFVEGLAREGEGKEVVFVLNKIDTVPRESTTAWLAHLRRTHPTFPFRVASALLPPPDDPTTAVTKTKVSRAALDDALGKEALLEYLNTLRDGSPSTENEKGVFTVAVVGMPNSGKSALINSLCTTSRLQVYKTDSSKTSSTTTTLPQPLLSSDGLQFVDTPGLALTPVEREANAMDVDADEVEGVEGEGVGEERKVGDALLRSRGRIEKMRDPEGAARLIISRANAEDLILHYNTPAFLASNPDAFLGGHARGSGRIKKGGILDITDSARSILRDWRVGKFPYYTSPPHSSSSLLSTSTSTASSPSALPSSAKPSSAPSPSSSAKATSAETRALYEKTDPQTLSHLPTRKDLSAQKSGLIRLKSGTVDQRAYSLDAPKQPEVVDVSLKALKKKQAVEEEDEAEEEESVEDAIELSPNDFDEEEEDEEEEQEEDTPPPKSTKRKRTETASTPSKKKVAFAAKKLGPAEVQQPKGKAAKKGARAEDGEGGEEAPAAVKRKSSLKSKPSASSPSAPSTKAKSKTTAKPTTTKPTTKLAVKTKAKAPQKIANAGPAPGLVSKKGAPTTGGSEAYDFGQFF